MRRAALTRSTRRSSIRQTTRPHGWRSRWFTGTAGVLTARSAEASAIVTEGPSPRAEGDADLFSPEDALQVDPRRQICANTPGGIKPPRPGSSPTGISSSCGSLCRAAAGVVWHYAMFCREFDRIEVDEVAAGQHRRDRFAGEAQREEPKSRGSRSAARARRATGGGRR